MFTFEEIIAKLSNFWMQNDCVILQSYDTEVGAGTLSPHTALRVLDNKPWNACYVQYSRRPSDARYGENPNRLGGYYQMQVILKPAPENVQDLCLQSLKQIGIDSRDHDIRFVEDDWENPSIGASGLGFEIWCDGMEVVQFTYMQRMGGMECEVVAAEITFGLERIAMYCQEVDNIFDITWHKNIKYSDVHFKEYENEQSKYYLDYHEDDIDVKNAFERAKIEANRLVDHNLILPAYEFCLKASHNLNILDARGLLSHSERTNSILMIRELVKKCCVAWKAKY
jgi:glycyl-tRNA synthetase alpha chain